MINNFEVIENFLNFEQGSFYKFELLVRNTDGENELFPQRCSNTNKNILIKSWYVDNKEYYQKIKHEMITMANLTGARLYMTLDRKDNVKLVQSLIHAFTDSLCAICNDQKPSIKTIAKTFASETSKVENSAKTGRTLMWDVDTKDVVIKQCILDYIKSKDQIPYILDTKKGYHIFCYRKFNHVDWLDAVYYIYSVKTEDTGTMSKEWFKDIVSVKANELGLVYHPMKNM